MTCIKHATSSNYSVENKPTLTAAQRNNNEIRFQDAENMFVCFLNKNNMKKPQHNSAAVIC